MKEVTGDLWSPYSQVKVVMTNGVVKHSKGPGDPDRAVMGAGTALQAKEKFPMLDILLADRLLHYGNHVYAFSVHPDKREKLGCVYLVTFPTKEHYTYSANIVLIRNSAKELVTIANAMGWTKILMPAPGTGITTGGLPWPSVKTHLQFLDDRFTIIHKE